MYPLRLSAADRRLYTRALSAGGVNASVDPDVAVEDPEDETTDEPKTGDTPTSPGTDPGANPMRFVTANIRHSMNNTQKRSDIQKVRALGSIIMWQEANPHLQPLLVQELPDADWDHVPNAHQVATRISVKRSLWKIEQATSYLMHEKNPNIRHRKPVVTTALVTSKTNPALQFLVTNSHFVPHAWCAHNVPEKEWRKRKWDVHFAKFVEIVADARSKGLTIAGGGDFNRPNVAKFHSSQEWFRQAHLDYLFGIPATGGASFSLLSNQSVSLNSDHNALVAELSWTAGANAVKTGWNWTGAH